MMEMEFIPNELLRNIFDGLAPAEYCDVLCSNSRWNTILTDLIPKKFKNSKITTMRIRVDDKGCTVNMHCMEPAPRGYNEISSFFVVPKEKFTLYQVLEQMTLFVPKILQVSMFGNACSNIAVKLPKWWRDQVETIEIKFGACRQTDILKEVKALQRVESFQAYSVGVPITQSILDILTEKSYNSASGMSEILLREPNHSETFQTLIRFLEETNFDDQFKITIFKMYGNTADLKNWLVDKNNNGEIEILREGYKPEREISVEFRNNETKFEILIDQVVNEQCDLHLTNKDGPIFHYP